MSPLRWTFTCFLYLFPGLGSRGQGEDVLGEGETGQPPLGLSVPICKMVALNKMAAGSVYWSKNSKHMPPPR